MNEVGKQKGTRLRTLFEKLRVNKKTFSANLGIKAQYLSHLMAGRKELVEGMVYRITAKYPRVNPLWLLSGEGEMFFEVPVGMVEEPQATYETVSGITLEELPEVIASMRAEIRELSARVRELEKAKPKDT